MITVAATEFSKNVGKYLDISQRETVMIQKQGRDAGVLVSPDEYSSMKLSAVQAFNAVGDAISAYAKIRGMTQKKLDALLADE